MRKLETLAKVQNMELILDFVAFCEDLDATEGTHTYDGKSFAALASTILEDDVKAEEVKEPYADLIAECIAYGKDAEIEEQKDYAMYRLGELYEEGRIGDPMVSEIIEDRIEEHFRCNDCNLFMACKDCYYLDK